MHVYTYLHTHTYRYIHINLSLHKTKYIKNLQYELNQDMSKIFIIFSKILQFFCYFSILSQSKILTIASELATLTVAFHNMCYWYQTLSLTTVDSY